MSESERVAVILFADICDSTPLYERRGDQAALGAISASLDILESLAIRHDGEVVRAKGDDLLCVFTRPLAALHAAEAMLTQIAGEGLAVRVGLHFGPLIEARGDIFGDAVNVAARLLDLAKPGEALATEALVSQLPENACGDLIALGPQQLKGRDEAVRLHSLVHDEGTATQFMHPDTLAHLERQRGDRTLVIIEYRTQRQVLRPGDADLRLGRSPRVDLVVGETAVSREHATVRVAPGRVTFTDHSSAGSWIGATGAGQLVAVRRETVTLEGDGVLFLGYPPSSDTQAPCVGFSVQNGARSASQPDTDTPAGTPRARIEPRFPVDDLGVTVFTGESGDGRHAEITNISYRGAMLVSRHRLGEPHERMRMSLREGGTTLDCELRFVGNAVDEDSGQFAHGVMFESVDASARAAIEAVLRAQGHTVAG